MVKVQPRRAIMPERKKRVVPSRFFAQQQDPRAGMG